MPWCRRGLWGASRIPLGASVFIDRFGISVPAYVAVSGILIVSGISGSVLVWSLGVSSRMISISLSVGMAWRSAPPVVAMVAAFAWQKTEIFCWCFVLVGSVESYM